MRRAMSGCVARAEHQVPDRDGLPVTDRMARVADRLPHRDDVRRAGGAAQLDAARDVVVVDVRLEHVGQPAAVAGEHGEDPVDVSLGVDDDRLATGDDGVAAIAQLRGLNRRNLGRHPRTIPHARGIGPG